MVASRQFGKSFISKAEPLYKCHYCGCGTTKRHLDKAQFSPTETPYMHTVNCAWSLAKGEPGPCGKCGHTHGAIGEHCQEGSCLCESYDNVVSNPIDHTFKRSSQADIDATFMTAEILRGVIDKMWPDDETKGEDAANEYDSPYEHADLEAGDTFPHPKKSIERHKEMYDLDQESDNPLYYVGVPTQVLRAPERVKGDKVTKPIRKLDEHNVGKTLDKAVRAVARQASILGKANGSCDCGCHEARGDRKTSCDMCGHVIGSPRKMAQPPTPNYGEASDEGMYSNPESLDEFNRRFSKANPRVSKSVATLQVIYSNLSKANKATFRKMLNSNEGVTKLAQFAKSYTVA